MTIVKPKRLPDGSVKCDIKHTRGDSGYIDITLTDLAGEPLPINNNDNIRCQVRNEIDGDVLFEGEIIRLEDGITWHIRPEDTRDAELKDYVWDGQIEYATGDIFTFVAVSTFTVMPDVTKEV